MALNIGFTTILRKFPLTLAFAFLVFVLCIIRPPTGVAKVSFQFMDKLAHFLVYFIMAMFLFFEANRSKWLFEEGFLLKTTILMISYGIVIEILQGTLFEYRSFDFMDIFANITGTAFGVFLIAFKKKL